MADVGWYSSGFRLCTCAFQFMFGKLYKLFSVKRIFMLANAILLVGSLLCSTATTSTMFVAGRAVTGVGFGGILGGLYTILTHILPLRRRPIFCGVLGGVENLAIIAAPIIGGSLTQSLGWRWCFWINLPIGGVALLVTFFLFSDPSPGDRSMGFRQKIVKLDLLSNLLFIPALTSLFIAFSWAGTKYPWDDGKVIGPLLHLQFSSLPFYTINADWVMRCFTTAYLEESQRHCRRNIRPLHQQRYQCARVLFANLLSDCARVFSK